MCQKFSDPTENFCTCDGYCRYKFWKYTGEIVTEVPYPAQRELWEVMWKPEKPGVYPEFTVDYASAGSTLASGQAGDKPLPGVNKDAVYVPPHMRNSKVKPSPAPPPGSRKSQGQGPATAAGVTNQPSTLSVREKEILKLQKVGDYFLILLIDSIGIRHISEHISGQFANNVVPMLCHLNPRWNVMIQSSEQVWSVCRVFWLLG